MLEFSQRVNLSKEKKMHLNTNAECCCVSLKVGTIYQDALEKITLSQDSSTKVCDEFSNTQIEFVLPASL